MKLNLLVQQKANEADQMKSPQFAQQKMALA